MGKGLSPRIRVSAPTGATITGTLGGDTVSFTEKSTGVYEADVEKLGPWTVSGTLGQKTDSTVVSVDDVGLFEGEMAFVSTTLNDNDWAAISYVSQAGTGANYWSVGDIKAVELKGTCGTLTLDTTLYCYILGFDHNSEKEGHGIHFGTWKDLSGKDLCLVNSNYGGNNGTGAKTFNLNHWGSYDVSSVYNTNYGGWKGCDARYDILGSTKTAPSGYGSTPTTSRVGYDAPTDTATSPVENTLMACLPSDLRAVMKPMTKYTDNYGNTSNVEAHVTTSVDYLPLLSEWEIFGARQHANEYEKNSQAQYAYYASGNSKVKYRHSSTDSTANWWERSPRCNDPYCFCSVKTDGSADINNSRYSWGLAPIFKV